MKGVKGCLNVECVAKHKKIHYKHDDNFCSKCGEELKYVCSKCHAVIGLPGHKYCADCQAKINKRNDQIKTGAVKAFGVTKKAISFVGSTTVDKVVKPAAEAVIGPMVTDKVAKAINEDIAVQEIVNNSEE